MPCKLKRITPAVQSIHYNLSVTYVKINKIISCKRRPHRYQQKNAKGRKTNKILFLINKSGAKNVIMEYLQTAASPKKNIRQ